MYSGIGLDMMGEDFIYLPLLYLISTERISEITFAMERIISADNCFFIVC